MEEESQEIFGQVTETEEFSALNGEFTRRPVCFVFCTCISQDRQNHKATLSHLPHDHFGCTFARDCLYKCGG